MVDQVRHGKGAKLAGESSGGRFAAQHRTEADGSVLGLPSTPATRKDEQLVIDTIAARGRVTVDAAQIREHASRNTMLARNIVRLNEHLAKGDQEGVDISLRLIADQVETPERLRQAGVERPAYWDEMGGSEKDMWEESQIRGLEMSERFEQKRLARAAAARAEMEAEAQAALGT